MARIHGRSTRRRFPQSQRIPLHLQLEYLKLIKYIYLSIKKNLNGIYNLSDYSISIKKLSLFIKARYGNKNTKIILKNKKIPNPKFFLIIDKFFRKMKMKKPDISEIINEI